MEFSFCMPSHNEAALFSMAVFPNVWHAYCWWYAKKIQAAQIDLLKVILAQSVQRLAEGSVFESRYERDCSPLNAVRSGTGAHPVGTASSVPWNKAAEA
jgi:hypothetical protein